MARERVRFQGLPARICWLGYGERARIGKVFNDLVASGEVKAPIVIGRDHLDAGSVASPYRETEGMRDHSDAIADWPILNALLNTAAGATWVSVHHGGGVGIGYSIHAGMVVVCDGTKEAEERIIRVLTTDPGTGVMRHADAGYELAIETAKKNGNQDSDDEIKIFTTESAEDAEIRRNFEFENRLKKWMKELLASIPRGRNPVFLRIPVFPECSHSFIIKSDGSCNLEFLIVFSAVSASSAVK